MDDRELEASLKTRLRARFDDAPAPADLAADVRQRMTTSSARFGFDLRTRGRRVGWSAVAAAVAIALIAVSLSVIPLPGPGGMATPSPTPGTLVQASERRFIVLAPSGLPSKPESSLASDVLAARIRALGIGTFTSSIGNAIQFNLPADGPSDASIRAVLAATGNVEFVPLPAADYGLGLGKRQAAIGQPLPKDVPSLFGWEGIALATLAYDPANSIRTVNMSLKPNAMQAFADYTTSHVGETFAILIDGRVAMLPVINEPIIGGEVSVSGGIENDFEVTSAILVGGMLPEAWRGASAPAIVSEEFAIHLAKGQFPYAPVASSDLDAEPDGGGWRAVWIVVVTGVVSAVVPCPSEGPGNTCFVPGAIRRVVIDAERGNVIRIEMPPE